MKLIQVKTSIPLFLIVSMTFYPIDSIPLHPHTLNGQDQRGEQTSPTLEDILAEYERTEAAKVGSHGTPLAAEPDIMAPFLQTPFAFLFNSGPAVDMAQDAPEAGIEVPHLEHPFVALFNAEPAVEMAHQDAAGAGKESAPFATRVGVHQSPLFTAEPAVEQSAAGADIEAPHVAIPLAALFNSGPAVEMAQQGPAEAGMQTAHHKFSQFTSEPTVEMAQQGPAGAGMQVAHHKFSQFTSEPTVEMAHQSAAESSMEAAPHEAQLPLEDAREELQCYTLVEEEALEEPIKSAAIEVSQQGDKLTVEYKYSVEVTTATE